MGLIISIDDKALSDTASINVDIGCDDDDDDVYIATLLLRKRSADGAGGYVDQNEMIGAYA
jgi:hypothetical protein